MNLEQTIETIKQELSSAIKKYPKWPTDPLHALAVLGEEYGELTQAMLQMVYEPKKVPLGAVKTEAIQTAAMAIRLIMSLEKYEYVESSQHDQDLDEGQAIPSENDELYWTGMTMLRNALSGLVGVSDKDSLEHMEFEIRAMQAPESDKEASINAIHALLKTMPEQRGGEK